MDGAPLLKTEGRTKYGRFAVFPLLIREFRFSLEVPHSKVVIHAGEH
jgi:hypothetical protein